MTRLFTALLAAMWLALAASTAIANGTPLRVATAADHPPLTYQADGKIVGMEADVARLLEQQLGRPLQLQILPAADLLPALARGDVDLVMSGLVITPEREKLVEFTVPYLRTGQMAVLRPNEAGALRALEPSTVMALGGEPLGLRYIEWNFVSSSRERIEQAKADWQAGRMKLPDLDSDEFVPFPGGSSAKAMS